MSAESPGSSSPVAGTNGSNKLEMTEASALYDFVARALIDAGKVLVERGQALQKSAGLPLLATSALPSLDGTDQGTTCKEAIWEFLLSRARSGRSDRYLQALRVSLKSFVKGRQQTPMGQVTAGEIEHWLEQSNWAPRTQKGYLSDVSVFYNWAKRRGLVNCNPARAVDSPVIPDKPPSFHTPDQVRKVMELARQRDLNLCRSLAIRYFTGLRSAEVMRLNESEIHLDEKFIEVTAAKSKTRRRRIVTIQDNLVAWLKLGGEVPLHDINNRMRWFSAALKAAHGIEWEHNVTRHSFVSYHLAQFQNAGKTALEAGHTEQMTFAHYRALVTPTAAAEFWKIEPENKNPPGTPVNAANQV